MLRRLAITAILFGFGLSVSTSWGQGVTARCNPDSIGTTSHGAGWDVSSTAFTVSAKPDKDKTPAAADRKTANSASAGDDSGASATGAGEDAGGNIGDGGGTGLGVRKHGMRWQSFLPGVIK